MSTTPSLLHPSTRTPRGTAGATSELRATEHLSRPLLPVTSSAIPPAAPTLHPEQRPPLPATPLHAATPYQPLRLKPLSSSIMSLSAILVDQPQVHSSSLYSEQARSAFLLSSFLSSTPWLPPLPRRSLWPQRSPPLFVRSDPTSRHPLLLVPWLCPSCGWCLGMVWCVFVRCG